MNAYTPSHSFNPVNSFNPFKRLSRSFVSCDYLVRLSRSFVSCVSCASLVRLSRSFVSCVSCASISVVRLSRLCYAVRLSRSFVSCVSCASISVVRLCYAVCLSWFVSPVPTHITPLRSFKRVKPVNSFKRPGALRRVKINFFKAREVRSV